MDDAEDPESTHVERVIRELGISLPQVPVSKFELVEACEQETVETTTGSYWLQLWRAS